MALTRVSIFAVLRLLTLLGAAMLPFSSALRGNWVYDDHPQILQNHLIQQPGQSAKALLSDVWAFKQGDEVPVSNYWRPTFVAWLIINERAFGVDDPLPWRIVLLLLHAATCLLVLGLTRRLGLAAWPAFAVSTLFAVHPVHAESVAWISGATDPLAGFFLLLSLCMLIESRRTGPWVSLPRTVSLAAYVLALGSKEVAVMLPLLIPFALACAVPESSWRQRFTAALPYFALAVGFLVMRVFVLQRFQLDLPTKLSTLDLMLNAPRLLLFYFGQWLWPVPMSPTYPWRATRLSDPLTWQLGAQWLTSLVLVGSAVWQARRSALLQFGGAFFALLLLPAFNLNAFAADQIVHDRYLYLPVLGLLLGFAAIWQARIASSPLKQIPPGMIALGFLTVLWGGMAWSYSRVWSNELSLWQRAVDVDSSSASSWAALAHVQWQRHMPEAASVSVKRALELAPVTSAYLLRADIAVAAGNSAAAENDLRKVLTSFPEFMPAVERLTLLLQRGQRLDEASTLLHTLRNKAPQFACRIDVDLAILEYLRGDKTMTRQLLEAAMQRTSQDRSGPCLAAYFHRAQLAVEEGDMDVARQRVQEYLAATVHLNDRSTQELRPVALQLSSRLESSPR